MVSLAAGTVSVAVAMGDVERGRDNSPLANLNNQREAKNATTKINKSVPIPIQSLVESDALSDGIGWGGAGVETGSVPVSAVS